MRGALLGSLVALALLTSCVRFTTKGISSKQTYRLASKVTAPVRADARIAVLWVGHATVLLQIDDKQILTDPVFTDTVAEISDRFVEPGIDPANLPVLDAVLLSHLHMDHLSYGSLDRIAQKTRQLVAPDGARVYIPDSAVPLAELATWSRWAHDGLVVTAVPVQHVGWRYGVDAAWMRRTFTGYVIEYHGLTVYFGGDTAYVEANFKATAARFPHIDLALLPIAPIRPRSFMRRTHVDPFEAMRAFLDLGAQRMVPIHFDTFLNGLDEEGDAPRELLRASHALGLTGQQVIVLGIGEQRVIVPRDAETGR
jgi:N-acyl-phosphatidylethanolamine-hydrolysing phospholipase D